VGETLEYFQHVRVIEQRAGGQIDEVKSMHYGEGVSNSTLPAFHEVGCSAVVVTNSLGDIDNEKMETKEHTPYIQISARK
jgi:hypothetical protein